MSALDPTTTETTFPVAWTGSDNLAGVRWYDIQYRDGDHGEWTDWQVNVTHILDAFIGQPGHNYCFRSRAFDNAGNWETYPGGDGDTCTLVNPGAAASGSWWNPAYASISIATFPAFSKPLASCEAEYLRPLPLGTPSL